MGYQAGWVQSHRSALGTVSSPRQTVPIRGEAAGVLVLPHPESLGKSHPRVQAKQALAPEIQGQYWPRVSS